MKSFVAYPHDIEKILFPRDTATRVTGKLLIHCELYKKVAHLPGSLVKCGIASEDDFRKFTTFRNMIGAGGEQHLVAFEKVTRKLYVTANPNGRGNFQYKNEPTVDARQLQAQHAEEKIRFIPGNICYSIAEYLIENPELKIAYLSLDLDDYESTLTALEFFYPRVVAGGIIIFDNYHKQEEDCKAVTDYFSGQIPGLQNFSVNKGPHYIVRD